MGLREKCQEMAWRDDWIPPVTLRPTVALDDLQGRTVLCTPCRSHHFHNQSHLLLLIFVYKSAQISILLRGYSPVNSEDLLFETFIAFTKCTAYLIFLFCQIYFVNRKILISGLYHFLYTFMMGVREPIKRFLHSFSYFKKSDTNINEKINKEMKLLTRQKLLIEK